MILRIKHCEVCIVDFSTMYRVQYKTPKEWVFVCKECLFYMVKLLSRRSRITFVKSRLSFD